MSKTPPEFEPIPSDAFGDDPINVAMREGSEPLITLRLVARTQKRIAFLTQQINSAITYQEKAGTLPPKQDDLTFWVSRVLISFDPATDFRGDEVADKGYPEFVGQTISRTKDENLVLSDLYARLGKEAAKADKLGLRLEQLLRHHYDVPDDIEAFSTVVTSGPLGWKTNGLPERKISVPGYYEA